MRELGVAQQRLRRDASDIEAHPAPVLLLDHRGAESELSGANCGDIAARTRAEDDDIEMAGHAPQPMRAPGWVAKRADAAGGCRGRMSAVAADLRRIPDKHVAEQVRGSVDRHTLDR